MAERREDVIRRLRRKGWSARQARKLAATPLGANAAPPFRRGTYRLNLSVRRERMARNRLRNERRALRRSAIPESRFRLFPQGSMARDVYLMDRERRRQPRYFDPSLLAYMGRSPVRPFTTPNYRWHQAAHSSPSHHVGPCDESCRRGMTIHPHARRRRR